MPPLERSLALIGADVHQWFSELPRPNMSAVGVPKNLVTINAKERRPRATLSQFFINMNCLKCGENVGQGRETCPFCTNCIRDPQTTTYNIVDEARKAQRRLDHINQVLLLIIYYPICPISKKEYNNDYEICFFFIRFVIRVVELKEETTVIVGIAQYYFVKN